MDLESKASEVRAFAVLRLEFLHPYHAQHPSQARLASILVA